MSRISRPSTRSTWRPPGPRPRTRQSTVVDEGVVCALCESRGGVASVGMAFALLHTGHIVLCEIVDSQTYARTIQKIALFQPSQIIVPSLPSNSSKLYKIITENVPEVRLVHVQRALYNLEEGNEYLESLCLADYVEPLRVAIHAKFYAVCSFAAILKHISSSHGVTFAPRSLYVRYEGSQGSMLVDFGTTRNLETVQNLNNPNSNHSLLGTLNHTQTPMGARLLRLSILQPLLDSVIINGRLDAMEELSHNQDAFFAIRAALTPFRDLDRLLTSLIAIPAKPSLQHSERRINDIITLKATISMVDALVDALQNCQCEVLRHAQSICTDASYGRIQEIIDTIINPDVQLAKGALDLRNQRCYAVKSGFNGLLDVARQTYKEATADVVALIERYNTDHEMAIDLKYETPRGFFMRAMRDDDRALPDAFINRVKKKTWIEFSSLELLKRNAKVNDSLVEILLLSDSTIETLTSNVRREVASIYRLSECVALLDMIASNVHLCTVSEYVRPEFNDKQVLAIKSGRHPIRERDNLRRFQANDTYAASTCRFQIITGVNMSGKSTYLKQVALLVIMACVDCWHVGS